MNFRIEFMWITMLPAPALRQDRFSEAVKLFIRRRGLFFMVAFIVLASRAPASRVRQ